MVRYEMEAAILYHRALMGGQNGRFVDKVAIGNDTLYEQSLRVRTPGREQAEFTPFPRYRS